MSANTAEEIPCSSGEDRGHSQFEILSGVGSIVAETSTVDIRVLVSKVEEIVAVLLSSIKDPSMVAHATRKASQMMTVKNFLNMSSL